MSKKAGKVSPAGLPHPARGSVIPYQNDPI